MKNAVGAPIPLWAFQLTSPISGPHLHPRTLSPFLSSATGILDLYTVSSLFLSLSCPQTCVVLSPTGLESLEGSRAQLSLAWDSLGLSADLADDTVLCPLCSPPHWGAVCWPTGALDLLPWLHLQACIPSWNSPTPPAPWQGLRHDKKSSLLLCCVALLNWSHFSAS